jgi:hypothetical protein
MTKHDLQIAASALILVALALIVIGLANESPMVWVLGLFAVGTAMLMSWPPAGQAAARNDTLCRTS